MTVAERMASFIEKVSYSDISPEARSQLKLRILDSLACAIGAAEGEPVRLIRSHVEDFCRSGQCTLIGGGKSSPDLAAFYNSALVRYLDFSDSYLAKGETCHPSDNLGSVMAASEYNDATGKDLITALAVSYQVQCRLSDEAPVRAKGFDHTTQGSFACAAGVSKALGLDRKRIANAIAISGTAFNALRVTRTGALSQWKGLAYPNTGFSATHATFLAMRGITGPPEVFEGNKGFMDTISGRFEINWEEENLERVNLTIIKKYNAEIHSQSALEGVLDLRREKRINPEDIENIDIDIFDVAFNIIGGGEEGEKTRVRTKEEADHSLQYMVAAALLDGQVMPDQYKKERISRRDIQDLLRRVYVKPSAELSRRFPMEMPCCITITLKDGRKEIIEKKDYEGFHTRPAAFGTVARKFEQLSTPFADKALRSDIIQAVDQIETMPVREFMKILAKVKTSR